MNLHHLKEECELSKRFYGSYVKYINCSVLCTLEIIESVLKESKQYLI